jgi:hypothetical protein
MFDKIRHPAILFLTFSQNKCIGQWAESSFISWLFYYYSRVAPALILTQGTLLRPIGPDISVALPPINTQGSTKLIVAMFHNSARPGSIVPEMWIPRIDHRYSVIH